jgi:DNA-directed RNA polymerase subunit RPC12/RpoP
MRLSKDEIRTVAAIRPTIDPAIDKRSMNSECQYCGMKRLEISRDDGG